MNLILEIKKLISNYIEDSLHLNSIPDIPVSFANEKIPAVFSSNIAFTIAKLFEGKSSPKVIAENMSEVLNLENSEFIFSHLNGFLNVNLKDECYVKILGSLNTINVTQTCTGQKISVEYISPNSNKSLHIGHLDNACIGQSIVNLYKLTGAEVNSEMLYNNRGISIEKLVYGFNEFEKKNPEILEFLQSESRKSQPLIDNLYLWASEKFASDKVVEQEVKDMVVKWESEMEKFHAEYSFENNKFENKSEILNNWRKVIELSLDIQNKTIAKLGCEFDKKWYESDFFMQGKNWVETGIEKNIFKIEDGAVLTNLKEYKISDTVVRKSDGTALYITQDLALTDLKSKNFPADKYIWVVGNEQSLAMKQMFAVCDQLGISKFENLVHVSYPFITIKGKGKMSSRKGTAVYIDELIENVKSELIESRAKITENTEEVNELNEAIDTLGSNVQIDYDKLALAAIKFSLLKYSRTTEVQFDINESINTSGFSGLYVMYAFVRCKSILSEVTIETDTIYTDKIGTKFGTNFEIYEKNILEKLYEFDNVVQGTLSDYSIHKLCHYLFELANLFNAFYANCPVLSAKDELKNQRIAIVNSSMKTLKLGLELLGIETVDRM